MFLNDLYNWKSVQLEIPGNLCLYEVHVFSGLIGQDYDIKTLKSYMYV